MAEPALVSGVALLLWSADPTQPERLATPFFHAAAAAAMELQVEIYFSARSVLLLAPGVAAGLHAAPGSPKSIYDYLQESVAHGARLLACTDALKAHGLSHADLIPECRAHGGAVQFMARTADPAWRSLVF
jgi:predicted peroxiredoxin